MLRGFPGASQQDQQRSYQQPRQAEGQRLQGQPLAAHQHDQAGLDQAVAQGGKGDAAAGHAWIEFALRRAGQGQGDRVDVGEAGEQRDRIDAGVAEQPPADLHQQQDRTQQGGETQGREQFEGVAQAWLVGRLLAGAAARAGRGTACRQR